MSRPSRFGRQPGFQVLKELGVSHRAVAEKLGVRRSHVTNSLSGLIVPSPELRHKLAELLGKDVTELFTPEALAAEPWMHTPKPLPWDVKQEASA